MFCERCESDQTFQMVSDYNWKDYKFLPVPKDAFEALCVHNVRLVDVIVLFFSTLILRNVL